MADAGTLISYRGDQNLGVGANPNIPAISPTANLDVINQTGRDIMLLDMQRNKDLYDQKVKDRDALAQLIANDQVATGNILPEYRDKFDEALKQSTDAFTAWKGNPNDIKGYRNYEKWHQHLKDVAAQAQLNTVGINALKKEQAQQELPDDQQAYQKHIDAQLQQNFWNPVNPYQKANSLDYEKSIANGVTQFKRVIKDPNDPFVSYDESYVDYADILKNKTDDFVKGQKQHYDQIDWLTKIQALPAEQLIPLLQAKNAQLDKYNADNHLAPGMPGYVEKNKLATYNGVVLFDKSGRPKIIESVPDFAAKWALASQPQFVSKGEAKLDKDMSQRDIALRGQKIDESRTKAQNAASYAAANKDNKQAAAIIIADPNTNIIWDKVNKLATPPDANGNRYIDITNLSDLDLSMLGGFTMTKTGDPLTTGLATTVINNVNTSKSQIPIKTDDAGNTYIELTLDKGSGTEVKRVYANDVKTNQNIYTTETGSKGEIIFQNNQGYNTQQGNQQNTNTVKFPLPAGKAATVKQNGYTYTWNTETGKYE